MAWAVHSPSSFGKFSTSGDFPGYEDALETYWENDLSDSEKEKIAQGETPRPSNIWGKFSKDLGPLADAEVPEEYSTKRSVKDLGSMIMVVNKLFLVDQDMKELIEELEPAVHQTWPVKIKMPRGKVYPKPFFGLRIGQFLDSFRPDPSDPDSFRTRKTYRGATYYTGPGDYKEDNAGLALSKSEIGEAHLWREVNLRNRPEFFISDTMQKAAAERGLQLPKHFQVMTV